MKTRNKFLTCEEATFRTPNRVGSRRHGASEIPSQKRFLFRLRLSLGLSREEGTGWSSLEETARLGDSRGSGHSASFSLDTRSTRSTRLDSYLSSARPTLTPDMPNPPSPPPSAQRSYPRARVTRENRDANPVGVQHELGTSPWLISLIRTLLPRSLDCTVCGD